SRIAPGRLKFHCWRRISLKERPPSDDQDKTNSWVRATSGSMKSNQMRLSHCGLSKTSLMVCCPGWAARQPDAAPGARADSTGYAASSEVTSTWATCSRSSQSPSGSGSGESLGTGSTTRLRMVIPHGFSSNRCIAHATRGRREEAHRRVFGSHGPVPPTGCQGRSFPMPVSFAWGPLGSLEETCGRAESGHDDGPGVQAHDDDADRADEDAESQEPRHGHGLHLLRGVDVHALGHEQIVEERHHG